MDDCRFSLVVFALIATTNFASTRVVNISNTWMLPEEGFPVFYRYFRDRISWYEADAVCQFHHANLVTADTTSQYDAIRAYLKELDISENIWIGLSKAVDSSHFSWTDLRALSGDGHWQQRPPSGNNPFCVVMDPAADFLWKPTTCGGPDVASFICELPVPSWALGPRGCLLTEVPSLTVLYIPEQLALELTSDCGLDGTKRISCKGDADRENILKQLTCDDFDDKSSRPGPPLNTASTVVSEMSSEVNGKTTKPWAWTSNTIDTDYGTPTRHRRETENTISPGSTKSTTDLSFNKKSTTASFEEDSVTEVTSVSPEDDVTLDSSLSDGSDKSGGLKMIQATDLTGQGTSETVTDAEVKGPDFQNLGEFPSAINQGQLLFSVIENGTMFDIIELNETEEAKTTKEVVDHETRDPVNLTKTTQNQNSVNSYTTVVYNKEPPAEATFVTSKYLKNVDKISKKDLYKAADAKKLNQHQNSLKEKHLESKPSNKMLLKSIEVVPNYTEPLTKLVRTHRKEVPVFEEPATSNFSTQEDNNHQHVEIKLEGENGNSTSTFHITTKRIKIDLENLSSAKDNETESETRPSEEAQKEEFLPKTSPDNEDNIDTVQYPTEAEPEAQPRPNRQRQLTRPQRRSFYPYFFSRVLG